MTEEKADETRVSKLTNEIYKIWQYEIKLPGSGPALTLKGHSRGSERTGFYIPELELFLDAGVQSPYHPKTILITHCHSDHSFSLPMLITGILTKPNIYVPLEHAQLFRNFNNAQFQLTRGKVNIRRNNHEIFGITPNQKVNDQVEMFQFAKDWCFQVFEMCHGIPCVGYGINYISYPLKDEYKGMLGKDLKALREQKIQLTQQKLTPRFAFVLDTNVDCFTLNPDILNYPVIITECTFFCEDTYITAVEGFHTHWIDLKPICVSHPEISFIITHFSMRYEIDEIIEFFKKENVGNVIVWTN